MNQTKKQKSISRRAFVKNTAYGIAGTTLFPTVLSSCSKGRSPNDILQIGHIGVGSRGLAELKGYFLPLKGARSVAICDLFRERRDKGAEYVNQYYKESGIKAPECRSYINFEEVLQRDDIDAVTITTPDHWHLLAAIKAANAGKHVMLAKPLGLSYSNYIKLKNSLSNNNVHFHYGTQQRASEHMQIGVDMIMQGEIGKIEHVDVWAPGKFDIESPQCNEAPIPDGFNYNKWIGPAPYSPYCPERVTNVGSWFNYDYSIGFLGGWGAHPLDIMVWPLKEKLQSEYSCEGNGLYWPEGGLYNNIITWDLNYLYGNGLRVHFVSTDVAGNSVLNHRTEKEDNGTTFYGTKGWISLSRSSAQSDIEAIDRKLNAASKESDLMGQMFLDVIREDREELCPLEDAIISDTISHMGDIAIRMQRRVSWNPAKGEILNDQEANKLFNREMRSPYTV